MIMVTTARNLGTQRRGAVEPSATNASPAIGASQGLSNAAPTAAITASVVSSAPTRAAAPVVSVWS